MNKERLEEMKKSNISIFLELLKKGEILYIDGRLCRRLKLTHKVKGLGRKNTGGYMQLTKTINGIEYSSLEHRIIYCHFNGLSDIPKGKEINHINGIKTDNRIENLELVTP